MKPIDALHRVLLRLDAETAHDLAIRGLQLLQRLGLVGTVLGKRAGASDPRLAQDLWGRRFEGPVGLAAGFDKDGVAIDALAGLGFGFLEVGTVTPEPQEGNPKPRLHRHKEHRALQNAMGFNNAGMEALGRRMDRGWPFGIPVGVNIGKNKSTPLDEAQRDYTKLFGRLSKSCDYLVINISSPNTPGLRDLQTRETLEGLVTAGRALSSRPVLVKIAPDLENKDAVDLSVWAAEAGAAGVILTNTTTDYSLVPGARPAGGLSGDVLKKRSRQLLRVVAAELFGRTTLISVGGIDSAAEIYERLKSGATLVQVYTALVYQGPSAVQRWHGELSELLRRDGVENLSQVVGTAL